MFVPLMRHDQIFLQFHVTEIHAFGKKLVFSCKTFKSQSIQIFIHFVKNCQKSKSLNASLTHNILPTIISFNRITCLISTSGKRWESKILPTKTSILELFLHQTSSPKSISLLLDEHLTNFWILTNIFQHIWPA